MSWKPNQFIQLVENATEQSGLIITPIWSTDHLTLLPNNTNSNMPLIGNKYELRRVVATNFSVTKHLAIYCLNCVSTPSDLMSKPLDGIILLVHHHNYLTALTTMSVKNIQYEQLVNYVVPFLENKGITNYFGSMIPVYQYISLDESTSVCIKAFRAHPELNDKEHIIKPAVITVSVFDQSQDEYNKIEMNTVSRIELLSMNEMFICN
jgi:hypothetical protein